MKRRLPRDFRLQQDQQDCGVACLRNILNYYQADLSNERLREWSGCGSEGTTLLGLYQAATEAGFKAQGVQAEYIADLRAVEYPCILPVTVEGTRLHYVVFYPAGRGAAGGGGGVRTGWRFGARREEEGAGAGVRREAGGAGDGVRREAEAGTGAEVRTGWRIAVPRKAGSDKLLIGDPEKGLCWMEDWQLEEIWPTRTVLLLEPGEPLSRWRRQRQKKLGWLWQMLKPDIHLLYTAIVLGIVCALLNLSTALFSQRLVDRFLPGKRQGALYAGLLLLGLLLIMKSVFSRLRQLLLLRQGYGFNTRLTGVFYRSILHLPKSFFDNRKTGDLVARLNDTLRIQQAASYILGEMAIQLLVVIAIVIGLFAYSWTVGCLCVVLLPVIFGVVKYFEGQVIADQRSVLSAHARNESNYVDSIRGIHTIKAMNREGLFGGIARELFAGFQGSVWKLGRLRVRFSTALEIIVALFGLAVIGWGAVNTLNGRLRVGELIAILQLAGMLMPAAVMVALTSLQVQEAVVALDRMYEFTMLEPEYGGVVGGGAVVGEAAAGAIGGGGKLAPAVFLRLSMRQVGFRFPGRKLLLKNISLEVEKGEMIAVTGESGEGKSTLLQVLQKFYGGEGGPILVNGRDLGQIDTVAWRKLIGVVPQEISVFCGTLLSNISLDLGAEHAEEVPGFCKALGFDRYFESFPQGYATMLGEGGVALSGGQKQLLALARCLYAKPQLLLLDEPTAAMDGATERFVIGVLLEVRKRMGILVISHKDTLTRIADRVYRLEGGVTTGVAAASWVGASAVGVG